MLGRLIRELLVPAKPHQVQAERRLHIGGVERRVGWEILNATPGPGVDHIGMADNLSRFSTNTFHAIYAAHVLEHLDFTGEIQRALKEWCRVLIEGGHLFVSVPDMDTLCRLFLAQGLSLEDRFMVVRMIFGGHTDRYDYHRVGLNFEILHPFLYEAGFRDIKRVADLGVFEDTSRLVFHGTAISLNVTARKANAPPDFGIQS